MPLIANESSRQKQAKRGRSGKMLEKMRQSSRDHEEDVQMDNQAPMESETIIGKGTTSVGSLKSENGIRIDGRLEGDVESESVSIGETGQVDGTVTGENVHIAGVIHGDVSATNLELTATAQLKGDLTVNGDIVMPKGARIDGKIIMQEAPAKLKAVPSGVAGTDDPPLSERVDSDS
jgi:cytoskeletal protein CcmA (bactofilin family)